MEMTESGTATELYRRRRSARGVMDSAAFACRRVMPGLPTIALSSPRWVAEANPCGIEQESDGV